MMMMMMKLHILVCAEKLDNLVYRTNARAKTDEQSRNEKWSHSAWQSLAAVVLVRVAGFLCAL